MLTVTLPGSVSPQVTVRSSAQQIVPDSRRNIRPDVANNPTVFLSSVDLARMVPPDSINNDLRRLMTRTFTSFKTGL